MSMAVMLLNLCGVDPFHFCSWCARPGEKLIYEQADKRNSLGTAVKRLNLPWEFVLAAKVHGFLPIFRSLRGKPSNDVCDNGQPVHPLLEEVDHLTELGHCVFPSHVPKHCITSCLQKYFI